MIYRCSPGRRDITVCGYTAGARKQTTDHTEDKQVPNFQTERAVLLLLNQKKLLHMYFFLLVWCCFAFQAFFKINDPSFFKVKWTGMSTWWCICLPCLPERMFWYNQITAASTFEGRQERGNVSQVAIMILNVTITTYFYYSFHKTGNLTRHYPLIVITALFNIFLLLETDLG